MTLTEDHDTITGTLQSGHPFAYARILSIFHTDVTYKQLGVAATSHCMEFLLVRHYRRDVTYKAGFHFRRLHRIGFVPDTDPDAFGFVDPDDVIRAAHLIPAFAHGQTDELLRGKSVARLGQNDWKFFYVNL